MNISQRAINIRVRQDGTYNAQILVTASDETPSTIEMPDGTVTEHDPRSATVHGEVSLSASLVQTLLDVIQANAGRLEPRAMSDLFQAIRADEGDYDTDLHVELGGDLNTSGTATPGGNDDPDQ